MVDSGGHPDSVHFHGKRASSVLEGMYMRSWLLLAPLVILLALAAACGSDDDDANDSSADDDGVAEVQMDPTPESEPDPTPAPTETPEPEPEPTATEVSVQETDDDIDEPESDDTADTDPGTADPGDLNALLLSVEDLPVNWTETEDFEEEDVEVGDVADDPFGAPCGIQPLEETYDPVAEADRSFQGTELGPFLSQNLVQVSSGDEAAQVMDTIRETFACEEWVEQDEFGEELRFEINEMDFQDIGDSSLAIRLGLSFGDEPEMDMFGEFAFDMVFVQRNEYISMFMYVDIFGMSEADFESIVRRADEKIDQGG